MDKALLKINKKLQKMIDTVNSEVKSLVDYTSDNMPLLDSEGDSYGLSTIVLSNNNIAYTISLFNGPKEYVEPAIRFYEDSNEPFLDEDVVDFLKNVRRDCKRGLKDFKMFNPDIHEDSEGNRKSDYLDKLNGSNIVSESLTEYVNEKN